MAKQYLTTAQAAARLGIKKATLYAYVSRGLLDKTVSDQRTSLFDPAQVDALRSDRRRTATGELNAVINSSITKLDVTGHHYRGRPVAELIAQGASFASVADLIWQRQHNSENWQLPQTWCSALHDAQSALPKNTPALDRLRVSLSICSALDPMRDNQSPHSFVQAGQTSIMAMAYGLSGLKRPRPSVVEQLWGGLQNRNKRSGSRRSKERLLALQTAMVLLADHGLATSTYGVRVCASTRADPYSVIATGLGAMGGVLHGSAATGLQRLFDRALVVGPAATIGEYFSSNQNIPGFGHSIYQHCDPREQLLFDAVQQGWCEDDRLAIVEGVRDIATERVEAPVNIDFPLAAMAWLGHFEERSSAIFSISRCAGWVAHAIEEMAEAPLRFRTAARYVERAE